MITYQIAYSGLLENRWANFTSFNSVYCSDEFYSILALITSDCSQYFKTYIRLPALLFKKC